MVFNPVLQAGFLSCQVGSHGSSLKAGQDRSPCGAACRLLSAHRPSLNLRCRCHTELLNGNAGRPPKTSSLRQMLAASQTRTKSPFVPSLCRLWGTVGRELEQAVRAVVRWHWIHGSCFLQCFMPTATAALQMRVNIAGEPSTLGRALSHGLNVKPRPAG